LDFVVLCEFLGFRSGVIVCDLVGCDESSRTFRSYNMRPLCCHQTSETKSPVISVLPDVVPDLSDAWCYSSYASAIVHISVLSTLSVCLEKFGGHWLGAANFSETSCVPKYTFQKTVVIVFIGVGTPSPTACSVFL
jgi:hypothetical protein